MKARLTIATGNQSSIFFNTLCDLELKKDKAQVKFAVSDEQKECRFTLGINRKKLFILRATRIKSNDARFDEIYLLSKENNEPNKASMSFGDLDLYLLAENYKGSIGKASAEAELDCTITFGEKKTELHRLVIICVSLEKSPQ